MQNRTILQVNNLLKLSKFKYLFPIILGTTLVSADFVYAQSAGDVLNKMNSDQRFGYIGGVVEGLATARWLKDKPDQTGMQCIYNWYLSDDKKQFNTMMTWLERHPDKPVGTLIHVLIKRECGE